MERFHLCWLVEMAAHIVGLDEIHTPGKDIVQGRFS
jgi:hypothetical protein